MTFYRKKWLLQILGARGPDFDPVQGGPGGLGALNLPEFALILDARFSPLGNRKFRNAYVKIFLLSGSVCFWILYKRSSAIVINCNRKFYWKRVKKVILLKNGIFGVFRWFYPFSCFIRFSTFHFSHFLTFYVFILFKILFFTQNKKIFFYFMFSPTQNREKKSQKKNKTSLKKHPFFGCLKNGFLGSGNQYDQPRA